MFKMELTLLLIIFYGFVIHKSWCCLSITFNGDNLGSFHFFQIPIENIDVNITQTGRPFYISQNKNLFLYHVLMPNGIGRWIIADSIRDEGDTALSYIDSWAITPYLYNEVTDKNYWQQFVETAWTPNPNISLVCDNDESLYFDTNPNLAPDLAGFYVLRDSTSYSEYPVYSQIKSFPDSVSRYLYFADRKWMIGETIGIDSCTSFSENDQKRPADIHDKQWMFIKYRDNGFEWSLEPSQLISREIIVDSSLEESKYVQFSNIYKALIYHRRLKVLPEGQAYYSLRNSLIMPVIGLGTGGLSYSETQHVIKSSLDIGYRLLDLAREYNNEHIVPLVFKEYEKDSQLPYTVTRSDVFIITKVWPTELGFYPTSTAIMKSLVSLETNYVDLYLLHWPACDPEVSWMHCETTVDPEGTWQGSWTALDKAYAEGRVAAVGVSNFPVGLLETMSLSASGVGLLPHVVQNWAEPGSVDFDVLDWCRKTGSYYQTYATLRNLSQLSSPHRAQLRKALKEIARKRAVSEHAVALRMMVQLGFAVIPRSSKISHLEENLNIFNWELLSDEIEMLTLYSKSPYNELST